MGMPISFNEGFGDEQSWPPGFRFHPTDEELILYYLKGKICGRQLKLDVIGELDIYKWDPEELPGQSKLKSGDRQWFFFSPRDRKYPNGVRSNRATRHGYWKVTGKDRNVTCNSRAVGVKKTLVFYEGRAPRGERTDWVMHEYTLDEEELKRCKTAQDYYALNKVYKKSGAGPKNGEQYGAPFREEEWDIDDNLDNHNSGDQENHVQPLNDHVPVDSFTVFDQIDPPLNDMEVIWNLCADELGINQPQNDGFAFALPLVGEEETQSTMVEPSLREAISTEQCTMLHPYNQQFDVQASFQVTQSDFSYVQSYEVPEVTSAPNVYEQEPHEAEDDFLEINDLVCPEPSLLNMGNPIPEENLQFGEIDGLDAPDLYFDAAMFLQDMGSIDQGTASHPYFDTLENDIASQLDYQLPSQSDDADHISSQLWTYDQKYNVFASTMGSNQVVMAPSTSGVVHVGCSTNLLSEAKQNLLGDELDGPKPWFTSSVWAALDSIPSRPALASENTLVNRAFERMSSFGRVPINARNESVAAAVREDSMRSRKFGSGYVRGLQQSDDNDLNRLKVAACCKHYTACDVDAWKGVDDYHFNAMVTKQD
ncbi:hypothetical protein HHK36_009388 [Tetracentron sinense]|uniref:NAC domain-containing protein n=1 Tax=Tetracentron sinense TaxID=13715 RepID=A0A835DI83_TETSI|nr:hypothetical protein HHK36_009388 [Tetracentron sinense]